MVVYAFAQKKGAQSSRTIKAAFTRFQAPGTIQLRTQYSKQYTGGGDAALIDGWRGTVDFRLGVWQGYEGHDLEAVIDLGALKRIDLAVAHGGTLFLDEIGVLSMDLQAKLLRVLQAGEFERLGSTRTRKVNVRIVAATHRDLPRTIVAGGFREDLYYRLNVFPITLPPLRERSSDIPLLVWSIIHRRQGELGRRIERVPQRAMAALTGYAWPGNVRELENVIERALVLSPGSTLHVEEAFSAATPGGNAVSSADLDAVTAQHIRAVLVRCGWRINGAGNAAAVLMEELLTCLHLIFH